MTPPVPLIYYFALQWEEGTNLSCQPSTRAIVLLRRLTGQNRPGRPQTETLHFAQNIGQQREETTLLGEIKYGFFLGICVTKTLIISIMSIYSGIVCVTMITKSVSMSEQIRDGHKDMNFLFLLLHQYLYSIN